MRLSEVKGLGPTGRKNLREAFVTYRDHPLGFPPETIGSQNVANGRKALQACIRTGILKEADEGFHGDVQFTEFGCAVMMRTKGVMREYLERLLDDLSDLVDLFHAEAETMKCVDAFEYGLLDTHPDGERLARAIDSVEDATNTTLRQAADAVLELLKKTD